jgi:GT2 family glycosyltransferase
VDGILACSVVVCVYTDRRWTDIEDCVASLLDQSVPPAEILMVVDHNDALLERAEEAFPAVRVFENSSARGLSGARNTAIAVAAHDIVAFIDDDAVPDASWCERLLAAFGDDTVVAVGGRALARWDDGPPAWFPGEFNWVVGCSWIGLPTSAVAVRNVIGCNMAFRRDVLRSVGEFRTDVGRIGTLPVGCEETELCIRIGQSMPGAIILFDPEIVVEHHVTADRRTFRYFFSRCWAEGLSKAHISRSVGSVDATKDERAYMLRTLPRGVATAMRSSLRDRRPIEVARAAAILVGVVTTAASYGTHRVRPGAPAARATA